MDEVAVVLGSGQQPLHRDEQLAVFFGVMVCRLLGPLKSFLLDAMFTIYQSQQCRVHMSRCELTLELGAAVLEGHGGLPE